MTHMDMCMHVIDFQVLDSITHITLQDQYTKSLSGVPVITTYLAWIACDHNIQYLAWGTCEHNIPVHVVWGACDHNIPTMYM